MGVTDLAIAIGLRREILTHATGMLGMLQAGTTARDHAPSIPYRCPDTGDAPHSRRRDLASRSAGVVRDLRLPQTLTSCSETEPLLAAGSSVGSETKNRLVRDGALEGPNVICGDSQCSAPVLHEPLRDGPERLQPAAMRRPRAASAARGPESSAGPTIRSR